MRPEWQRLASLFGNGEISVAAKITAFVAAMDWPNKDPAIYAKALCWLAYRDLAGYQVPIARVEQEIEAHLPVLLPVSRAARQTWAQSLEMVRCYLALLRYDDFESAILAANRSIAAFDGEVNPGGITNAARACALRMALSKNHDELLLAERLFKQAVPSFPVQGSSPALIRCLADAANALQICSAITSGQPSDCISGIDASEPFNSAIKRCLGLTRWWSAEDERYSALYKRGYGPARPMEVVRLAGCRPHDRAIDLGCGRAALAEFFGDYTGVDVSSFVIAQNRLDKKGVFVHASLDDLAALRGQVFDVAVCADVMEHVPTSRVGGVLHSIAALDAKRHIFAICCRPSVTMGPQGENLHPTVMPPSWWLAALSKFFAAKTLYERPDWALFDCRKELSVQP